MMIAYDKDVLPIQIEEKFCNSDLPIQCEWIGIVKSNNSRYFKQGDFVLAKLVKQGKSAKPLIVGKISLDKSNGHPSTFE